MGLSRLKERKCNNLAYILTIMGHTKYFFSWRRPKLKQVITLRGISANSCMDTSRNYLFWKEIIQHKNRETKKHRFNIIAMKGKSHNNNWIIVLQTSRNGKSVDLHKYNVSCEQSEALKIIREKQSLSITFSGQEFWS